MRLKSIFLLTVCLSFFCHVSMQGGSNKSYSYITEQAIYDNVTEARYVFVSLPKDPKAIAYANQHQVFFADPYKLVLYLPNTEQRLSIEKLGYTLKSLAVDAYEINVTSNVMET
ncbi:MAG TPA: hypothetical protein PLU10_13605, partial [Chitinophagaceae bacterium]|nr:hypothetical protein [Chitinophagaceae bacterium]